MATPAAVISSLIKVEGLSLAAGQMAEYDRLSRKTASSADAFTTATANQGKAARTSSRHVSSATKAIIGMGAAFGGYRAVKGAVDATENFTRATLQLSRNFGLSTRAASEWGAVMQARGVTARQLTMGFKTLSTQVLTAGQGSKKSAAMFQELGISQEELRRNGNNLQWVLNAVSDGISKLPPGTNRAAIMSKMFGRTWMQVAPLIRDGSKSMNDQLRVADKYGAVLGGSTKATETMVARQREFKLAMLGLQMSLASVVIPVVNILSGTVLRIIQTFRSAPPTVRTVALVILGAATAFSLLNMAMRANPILLIATALVGLGMAFVTAYQHSASFRNVINSIWQTIQPVVGAIGRFASSLGQLLAPAVHSVVIAFQRMGGISGIWNSVRASAGGTITWLTNAWRNMTTWIVTAWRNASNALRPTVQNLGIIFSTAFNLIKAVTLPAIQVVKAAFGPLMVVMRTVAGVLKSVLVAGFHTAWNLVKIAMNGIKGAVSGTFNIIRGIIAIFAGLFTGDFRKMWNGVKQVFSGAFKVLRSMVSTAVHGFVAIVSGVWNAMYNAGKFIIHGVGSGIKAAFNSVIGLIVGFLNDIIDVITKLPFIHIGHIKAPHFAQGGVFEPQAAARGQVVSRPGYFAGEEAPRHPEVIIATNPAYRQRNLGLLAKAGEMLGAPGFARGGIVTASDYSDHGPGAFGIVPDVQNVMGFAELQMGHALGGLPPGSMITVSYGGKTVSLKKVDIGLGGPGLGGHTRAIDLTMPAARALGFNGLGNVAWSTGGGGGGILSTIGGLIGDVVGAAGDVIGSIIGALPKLPKLPDWISNIGSYVLNKAKDFIASKADLFGGGGAGGPSATAVAPPGSKPADVEAAMMAAARHIQGRPYVWGGGHGAWEASGYDCSGAVSYLLHAGGFLNTPEATGALAGFGDPGSGKYITIGVSNGGPGGGHTMINMFGRYFESGGGPLGPHWDHGWSQGFQGYRHPHGYATGGVYGSNDFGMVPPNQLLQRTPSIADRSDFKNYQQWYASKHGAKHLAYGGMFGNGGSLTVTKPTMAVFGENGPETAMFIPHYQAGAITGLHAAAPIKKKSTGFLTGPSGGVGLTHPGITVNKAIAAAAVKSVAAIIGLPKLPRIPGRAPTTLQGAAGLALQNIGLRKQVEGLASDYSTLDQFYNLNPPQLTKDDGSIDQAAINRRVDQLKRLQSIRQQIFDIWGHVVVNMQRLVQANQTIIAKLEDQLSKVHTKGLKGKKLAEAQKLQSNTRTSISKVKGSLDQAKTTLTSDSNSRTSAWLDVLDIRNQIDAAAKTKGTLTDTGGLVDTSTGLDTAGTTTTTDTNQLAYLQAQLDLANAKLQTILVDQMSPSIFTNIPGLPPFGGSFAEGGVVPGPLGAPRTVIAHGGESIVNNSTQPIQIQVIVMDGAVDQNKIKVIAKDVSTKVIRGQSRASTRRMPGNGGGRVY